MDWLGFALSQVASRLQLRQEVRSMKPRRGGTEWPEVLPIEGGKLANRRRRQGPTLSASMELRESNSWIAERWGVPSVSTHQPIVGDVAVSCVGTPEDDGARERFMS